MKPTLFILCGYPFAGKSTLCEKIVNITADTVHFCIDSFFDQHPELKDEEDRWDFVFQYGQELSGKALTDGKHVLYDATNYLKKERAKLRKLAKSCGGDCAVLYVEIPKEEARKRLEENRKTLIRKDVDEKAWDEVTGDFEVPTSEENVLLCPWDVDKSEWIRNHIR